PIYLLDTPDVDSLDHVASLGIDHHRAARAFPAHALDSGDQRVAVGLAAGLLQRLVDGVHAVVTADREHIGVTLELGVVGSDEGLVIFRLVVEVVVERGDQAEPGVAHAFQRVFGGQFTLAHDLDLVLVDTAFGDRLADGGRLWTARHPDVN